MTYGYIRVSSDKQTVENQRFEILNYCKRQNITVDGWIEETISGTKNYDKRLLGDLLKKVKKDDLIICSELSRLGRNLFMIMEILSICMKKECKVWTIKDNYRLGDDMQSKVLAFAFGLSAEIERNLISQRTIEALKLKRAQGVILGRPKGRKTSIEKHKLFGKEEYIKKHLEQGLSQRVIAARLNVNRNTLGKYIKANIEYKKPENRKQYSKEFFYLYKNIKQIQKLIESGVAYVIIARMFGVCITTLKKFLDDFNIKYEKENFYQGAKIITDVNTAVLMCRENERSRWDRRKKEYRQQKEAEKEKNENKELYDFLMEQAAILKQRGI